MVLPRFTMREDRLKSLGPSLSFATLESQRCLEPSMVFVVQPPLPPGEPLLWAFAVSIARLVAGCQDGDHQWRAYHRVSEGPMAYALASSGSMLVKSLFLEV